jgi:hypothetical protein
MSAPSDEEKAKWTVAVATCLWSNRDWILARLKELREWFRSGRGTEAAPGILILGPGGAGKTTLARLLSEEDPGPLLQLPGEYEESIGVESCALRDAPGGEIVVPPGQVQRREATWADLHADLASGKFRGVVMLAAYGHNSFMLSYRQHRLYDNNKDKFLEDYCTEQRGEELAILRQLAPHLTASRGKLWMLTLVAKQDLWWPKHIDVEKHYLDGAYAGEVNNITDRRGKQTFRHEFAFASLVISNFVTGTGEILKPNAAGYDQRKQVESVRKIFEIIDALREWEAKS